MNLYYKPFVTILCRRRPLCSSKSFKVTGASTFHTQLNWLDWSRSRSRSRSCSGVASYGAQGHMPPLTSSNFIFSSLWSKSDSQLSKYCVVCEIGWCRCQQLTALSISTALVTKLLVIEQLLHPAVKSTVSAPWHNFQLCPSSQQILATPLRSCTLCSWFWSWSRLTMFWSH